MTNKLNCIVTLSYRPPVNGVYKDVRQIAIQKEDLIFFDWSEYLNTFKNAQEYKELYRNSSDGMFKNTLRLIWNDIMSLEPNVIENDIRIHKIEFV